VAGLEADGKSPEDLEVAMIAAWKADDAADLAANYTYAAYAAPSPLAKLQRAADATITAGQTARRWYEVELAEWSVLARLVILWQFVVAWFAEESALLGEGSQVRAVVAWVVEEFAPIWFWVGAMTGGNGTN
jgi:hypothetical protein